MRFSMLLGLVPALAIAAAACAPEEAPAPGENAAAAPAAEGQAPSIEFTGDFKGPLGLQLWSVREVMAQDVPGTLAKVRALGFSEVELAGTYGMTPQAFRQELDRAGLDASAMHAPYERLRDSLQLVLEEAKTLGVEYLGVAWVPHEGNFTDATARQTAAHFNRWGEAARDAGIQFFYHNHGYEFRPGPGGTTPFDLLVGETDPRNVKFEMDVFWTVHPGVDPVALLRKYPDRWRLMHIKDMKQGVATGDYSGSAPPESEAPVGQGQVNWPAVLAAARDVGVEKYYVEDETADPLTNIATSLEYLRGVEF